MVTDEDGLHPTEVVVLVQPQGPAQRGVRGRLDVVECGQRRRHVGEVRLDPGREVGGRRRLPTDVVEPLPLGARAQPQCRAVAFDVVAEFGEQVLRRTPGQPGFAHEIVEPRPAFRQKSDGQPVLPCEHAEIHDSEPRGAGVRVRREVPAGCQECGTSHRSSRRKRTDRVRSRVPPLLSKRTNRVVLPLRRRFGAGWLPFVPG